MAKVIDGWTLGGALGHPSTPGERLQRLIGNRIKVEMESKTLLVPTAKGWVRAQNGDYIALYDNDTLEVRVGGIDGKPKNPIRV